MPEEFEFTQEDLQALIDSVRDEPTPATTNRTWKRSVNGRASTKRPPCCWRSKSGSRRCWACGKRNPAYSKGGTMAPERSTLSIRLNGDMLGFPRTRGDRPERNNDPADPSWAPPHTRG